MPSDFLLQFVIGSQPDHNLEIDLYAEAQEYADIVRYNSPDIYRHLFLKTHALLKWFEWQCPEADYLIKVDDDAILHLKRVNYFIGQELNAIVTQRPKSMFCKVETSHHPFRNPLSKL
jgi:hypothetical protein